MFLKLTQNNATALWNSNCGVESVNGINEHIIQNSVKNSVFSRFCNITLTTFTKVLKLIEGFVWTIWNCLEFQHPCFLVNVACNSLQLKHFPAETMLGFADIAGIC